VAVVPAGFSSSAFMADLKPRMLSPSPLPNSGSFLGPNTSKAIPKTISKCIGGTVLLTYLLLNFSSKNACTVVIEEKAGAAAQCFRRDAPTRQLASAQQ